MKSVAGRFKVVPAVYVIFRDGKKILLLRRANTGYHDGQYSLPSGHIDGNEPAVQAACREAKEEVGVTIEPKNLRLVHTLHRYATDPGPHERIDLYFVASKWHGELVNAEPEKCDELRWADSSDLPKTLTPEVTQALDKIARGEPYSDFNF